jgi:DNA-binding transcriptional regulator YdaS (Cro superfamily)
MTPTRYRECLDAIGWTPWGLATRLGVHETRTRRWGTGRYEIPENVARWLERLAQAHDAAPLPDGWTR